MSSSFALRSTSVPFPFLPSAATSSSRLLPFSSSFAQNLTLTSTNSSSLLHFGPSLSKGLSVPPPPIPAPASSGDDDRIDPSSFARSFPLAALRVPASLCYQLENRLRGHLLNWPRIPNIARVPSDDVDPDVSHLLPLQPHRDRLQSLAASEEPEERPRLSPILYRDKLARDFNCRGFLNFRNLAKMSRPRMRKEKKARRDGRGGKMYFEVAVVDEEEDLDDMRGLLGEGFEGRWRGPTRLLLLDERYAGKGVEDLPEAVKVAV